MIMTIANRIVLGLICISVIISLIWQIRMTRRNRTFKQVKPEQTEETV